MFPLDVTVNLWVLGDKGTGPGSPREEGTEWRKSAILFFPPILHCKLLLNTSEFQIATEKVHKPFSSNLVTFITFLFASPDHRGSSQFQRGRNSERLKAENSGKETSDWSRIQGL